MKTSSDVICQTHKFYAQANIVLHKFRDCTNDIKYYGIKSFCAIMFTVPFFGLILLQKGQNSYNCVLHHLLLIRKS